jgi:valyl-tRNA synthetase
MLIKETGLTRHDLGREAFLAKVWEWKEQYGSRICDQIRQLGSSVDWSREAFTMDAKCSAAVVEAFCRFHEKGILFRDKRLINWSCRLKSAISDIEVDHEDIEGGAWRAAPGHTLQAKYQFGMFTEFAYKVLRGCVACSCRVACECACVRGRKDVRQAPAFGGRLHCLCAPALCAFF